jgi:hypothetical protein
LRSIPRDGSLRAAVGPHRMDYLTTGRRSQPARADRAFGASGRAFTPIDRSGDGRAPARRSNVRVTEVNGWNLRSSVWSCAIQRAAFPSACALRSDDTEAVSAKHQPCPHLVVHMHPGRILQMGRCIERAFRSLTPYEERGTTCRGCSVSRPPVTAQGRTPRCEPFQQGPFREHQVDPVGTFLSSFHGVRQHKISS